MTAPSDIRPLSRRAGFVAAMVSSCTFGMIPLFAMPCTAAGMSLVSVLVYRFAIASATMVMGPAGIVRGIANKTLH